MNEKKQTRKDRFRKSEWMGVLAIFLIAVITGYFYMRGRLEKSEENQIHQEQTVESPAMDGSDLDTQ